MRTVTKRERVAALLFFFMIASAFSLTGCGGGGGGGGLLPLPVNHPPLASSQTLSTSKDTPLDITLAATDADGDATTLTIIKDPLYGAITGTVPNITYTPSANFCGWDSLRFEANDGKKTSAPGRVLIQVDCPAPAIAENLSDNLATSASLTDSGWTEAGAGIRTGIKLQSGGNTLTYNRTDMPIDGKAFMIEAAVSADALALDGERGARLWAWFGDSALAPGDVYQVDVRLTRRAGTPRVELYDTAAGVSRVSLDLDWTNAGIRNRIRLKRQQLGGQDYIFLQAEPSSGWDDPAQPNVLSSQTSTCVLLSTFTSGAGSSEVGFGNLVSGAYASEWEYVHVTVASDLTTVLPYWPPAPPAPALAFDDKGMNVRQGIDFDADLSAEGYLATDAITPWLNADGIDTNKAAVTDPGSAGPLHFDFDNLGDNQTTTGKLEAVDPSGRTRIGPETLQAIPNRNSP